MVVYVGGIGKMDATEIHARRLNAEEVIQTEEQNKEIVLENQTGLLKLHFETHRGMMVKPKVILIYAR